MYLIIDNVDGYVEEKNRNKYLILASTDKNKEVLTKTQNFGTGLKSWLKKWIINQVNLEKISWK